MAAIAAQASRARASIEDHAALFPARQIARQFTSDLAVATRPLERLGGF